NAIIAPSLINEVVRIISSCCDMAIKNKMNIFLDNPFIPAALLNLPLSVFLLFLKTTASNKPLKKSILINTISAIIKLSNPPKRYEKKDPNVPTMNKALYLYFIIIYL